MGSCCSSDASGRQHYPKVSTRGVGMGVAMMMQQAGALVGACPTMDVLAVQAAIRKAKAEGRTVTVVNGNLYIDYQLISRVPSDFNM
ncbi:hypothetical protein AB6A40_006942 [Gnathostoma spinigerum]|uniref:Uncharacterized protein n=1 Tax=Gnathostoma spinigerum TaxID=75299 RepID=A0ABD6ET64_9BILA